MALEYHLMMQDENKTSYSLLKFVLQQIISCTHYSRYIISLC